MHVSLEKIDKIATPYVQKIIFLLTSRIIFASVSFPNLDGWNYIIWMNPIFYPITSMEYFLVDDCHLDYYNKIS